MSEEILRIEGVKMHFGGIKALNGLTMSVHEGEFVGIIGPNGAGKTTLFNVITGMLKATDGSVKFRGGELVGLSPDDICRKGIARTYQKVRPFPRLSVLDNVTVAVINREAWRGSMADARKIAAELVAYVGLEPFLHSEAADLNLFQRKKIELARALGSGGQLLLLDEVMAGLNPGESDAAVKLLLSLRTEFRLTVLCIEHVMEIIMTVSDRVVALDRGQVIATGTPAEVAADPTVQRAYLGVEHA
jgi:branched-chain amino acid transport system ATP-binding protein